MSDKAKKILESLKAKKGSTTKKDTRTGAQDAARAKTTKKTGHAPTTKKAAPPAVVQKAAPVAGFDYATIEDAKARKQLQAIEKKVVDRSRRALKDIVEIGNQLAAAKDICEHGDYKKWCERACGYSYNHAYNMMRISRKFGQHPELIGTVKLPMTSIMRLSQVEDDTLFEKLVDRARTERLTEPMIKAEIDANRVLTGQPAKRGPGRPKKDGSEPGGSSPAEKEERKRKRMLRSFDEIRKQISHGVAILQPAIKALTSADVEVDGEDSTAMAALIKQELTNLLEDIIPFFEKEEVDRINGDRKFSIEGNTTTA